MLRKIIRRTNGTKSQQRRHKSVSTLSLPEIKRLEPETLMSFYIKNLGGEDLSLPFDSEATQSTVVSLLYLKDIYKANDIAARRILGQDNLIEKIDVTAPTTFLLSSVLLAQSSLSRNVVLPWKFKFLASPLDLFAGGIQYACAAAGLNIYNNTVNQHVGSLKEFATHIEDMQNTSPYRVTCRFDHQTEQNLKGICASYIGSDYNTDYKKFYNYTKLVEFSEAVMRFATLYKANESVSSQLSFQIILFPEQNQAIQEASYNCDASVKRAINDILIDKKQLEYQL